MWGSTDEDTTLQQGLAHRSKTGRDVEVQLHRQTLKQTKSKLIPLKQKWSRVNVGLDGFNNAVFGMFSTRTTSKMKVRGTCPRSSSLFSTLMTSQSSDRSIASLAPPNPENKSSIRNFVGSSSCHPITKANKRVGIYLFLANMVGNTSLFYYYYYYDMLCIV